MTALLKFFLVGLVALMALSFVLALVGTVFSVALAVAGILLFKVLPIVLVGYVVVRLLAPRLKRIANRSG